MRNLIVEVFGNDYEKIEVIRRKGQRWYRVHDICNILNLKNASATVRGNARIGYYTIDSEDIYKDGDHKTAHLYVSEAGLYKVILKSRKPAAMRLKNALSKEVLPQIMKTGFYLGIYFIG